MRMHIESGFVHPLNYKGMVDIIKFLSWELVPFDESNIVWSPSKHLYSERYPEKKFIFGPHFSVFPNEEARKISSVLCNSIYIQPSKPSVDTWKNEFGFNNIPVVAFPFPVFIPEKLDLTENKKQVLIYYKKRDPAELYEVKSSLSKRNINFSVIKYGEYEESDFQTLLDKTSWVFCLGQHESQGFAIQSIMAKNIPILVWSVKQRSQEYGGPDFYKNVKTEVSTVPYWDNICGLKFYNLEDMDNSIETFLENLPNYKPREFVKNNLSLEVCSNRLVEIIKNNFN